MIEASTETIIALKWTIMCNLKVDIIRAQFLLGNHLIKGSRKKGF